MIVVVGSANMDMVLRVQQLPRPGETVSGHGFETMPGGKGANQAVAAARLGAEVHFVGCVGSDVFGAQMRGTLQAEGVNVDHLATVSGPSGVAIVLVDDANGQNSIAIEAGANAALSAAHIDAAAATIAAASMLVCQLESPLPAVQRAITVAHAAGVPVLLNPAPVQPLPPQLLQQVSLLVPNESEAAALAGQAPGEPVDEVLAAERLRRLGAATVIVTLGERGVHVSTPGGAVRHDAQPAARVVDTTGAGDTFIGALAAARCRDGLPLHDAVAFAQRAAAFSVSRRGAMSAMPHREELLP
jgi:ribokinase